MGQEQTPKDKQVTIENKGIVNSSQQKVLAEDKLVTNTSKKKILIAEDEEGLRNLIIIFLGKNYEVIGASNGKEALDKFKECKIDLVVTDLSMPLMDGFQLFTEIKKICPEAKILLMSGQFDKDKIKIMLENGALGLVIKPFDITEFRDKVNSVLSDKSD